jgi:hypothetical protein
MCASSSHLQHWLTHSSSLSARHAHAQQQHCDTVQSKEGVPPAACAVTTYMQCQCGLKMSKQPLGLQHKDAGRQYRHTVEVYQASLHQQPLVGLNRAFAAARNICCTCKPVWKRRKSVSNKACNACQGRKERTPDSNRHRKQPLHPISVSTSSTTVSPRRGCT